MAACLADLGYQVVGIHQDPAGVEALNRGQPPLYEPGLEDLLSDNLSAGRLRFTEDLRTAASDSQYVIMAFDTPVDQNDEVDLTSLYSAALELAEAMEPDSTLIVSSQVPVGTCEDLARAMHQIRPGLSFSLACLPENLRLGQAIERFKRPDVVVIGADRVETVQKVERLLAPIPGPRIATDLRTAEMTKHVINDYLATMITFANDVGNLCDMVGVDALKVLQALAMDSRVSPKAPLRPGLAFGGGTLARDLRALYRLGSVHKYTSNLISGVVAANAEQNRTVAMKLKRIYPSLQGLTLGVLGLTYKAGTSTLRRSPAIEMIQALVAEGARVKAYDPKVAPEELASYSDILTFCGDPYAVARGSYALLLVTDWPEFKQLDFDRISASMEQPVLLDAQNMLDADVMTRIGFVYQGVGRGGPLQGSPGERTWKQFENPNNV